MFTIEVMLLATAIQLDSIPYVWAYGENLFDDVEKAVYLATLKPCHHDMIPQERGGSLCEKIVQMWLVFFVDGWQGPLINQDLCN